MQTGNLFSCGQTPEPRERIVLSMKNSRDMTMRVWALLCITFLALGQGQESGPKQGWSWPTLPPEFSWPTLPPDFSWPTLPPDWTDWSPGGPFPTLGPSTTILPPEWTEGATVTIDELEGSVINGALSFTSPVTSPKSRKFFWFAGIPYANPVSYTGANRFKPSSIWEGALPKNANGVFSAINPLIWCPQSDVLPLTADLGDVLKSFSNASKTRSERRSSGITPQVQGVEDCLVLNINTPYIPEGTPDPAKLLPVIVFIHGGSFDLMWGGIFGGHRFLNRDVVLISINYRLGILGSLNLGIDDAPGNAAMYDVITSLEWVREYIHRFGGDKNKVTVTGHSAGAVIASHLLTSPLSKYKDENNEEKTLVHGIIGLSGSAMSQWATCTDPETHHLRVAYHANCYDNSTGESPNFQEIRNCMADRSILELLDAVDKYSDFEREEGRLGFDAKVPSLQDEAKLTVPVFMPKTPYEVLKAKEQLDIPLMMGATRHDGTFVMEDTYDKFLVPNNYVDDPVYLRNELLPTLVGALGLEDSSGELIHSLGNLYLGEAMHTDDFESKIPGLIDVHSVFGFKAGAYSMVEMHSKLNANSYYFAFEYWGLWTVDGGEVIPGGIGHIDSIFYLFQAFPLIIPRDQSVAYRFVDYWVNFATYGNPNGEGPQTVASRYNPLNHAYLKIANFDSTGYYCRDSWLDNSLEIMKSKEEPGTSTSTEETGGGGGSSAVGVKFELLLMTFIVLFRLIM